MSPVFHNMRTVEVAIAIRMSFPNVMDAAETFSVTVIVEIAVADCPIANVWVAADTSVGAPPPNDQHVFPPLLMFVPSSASMVLPVHALESVTFTYEVVCAPVTASPHAVEGEEERSVIMPAAVPTTFHDENVEVALGGNAIVALAAAENIPVAATAEPNVVVDDAFSTRRLLNAFAPTIVPARVCAEVLAKVVVPLPDVNVPEFE